MAQSELTDEQIQRLLRDIEQKLAANRSRLEQAEGEITLRLFRRGPGFDVKLTVTT